MAFNFEKLEVLIKSEDYICEIYKVTKSFPKEEIYGLIAQLRRAALSVSLNIAEGSSKSKKDFRRFIDIARGSVFENIEIIKISFMLGYINKSEFASFEKRLVEISKMLSGLKRSIIL